MKNKIIIPFFLVFLVIQGVSAGNYSAYEGTTDEFILGGTSIGYDACAIHGTNTGSYIDEGTGGADSIFGMDWNCPTACSANQYISVPYAGNTSWRININGVGVHLFGIILATDHTYTSLDCGVIPGSNLTANVSCYSNIGYYFFNKGALGNLDWAINMSHSSVTYTVIEDIVYEAGDNVYMPVITRFANCSGSTGLRDTSIIVNYNTLFNTQKNTHISYENYKLSCSEYGTTWKWFYDYKKPAYSSDQVYKKGVVINELTPLNFTSIYPINKSIMSYDLSSRVNFSVIANNPSVVDYIAWYINGELVQYDDYYNFSYLFIDEGTYIIEAQLEDNDCLQYPIAEWTVNIGKTVTVYGKVVDNNNNPVTDAVVSMYDREPVYTNSSGDYRFNNITGLCNTGLTYFLYASKEGYTTGVQNFTPICGSSYETLIPRNFRLSPTTTTGSVQIHAIDFDTDTYLNNYVLELSRSGMHVLTIENGTVTYNFSSSYYNATDTGNPTTITQLPIGYSYTATITKTGYKDSGVIRPYLSTNTWTQTDQYETDVYLYLVQEVDFNVSANWSNLSPTDGENIDATGGITQLISGTVTTDQNTYKICVYYQENGATWHNYCLDERITGIYTHGEIIYIQPNKVYNYYFTAEYNSQTKFNSPITSFTTNGTAPTTTTSTSIHYATTTTIYHLPTNQSHYNGSHTQKEYNCTNPWALIKDNGDWYHGSICMYVTPLGVDWTYGLTFILIIMYVYIRTRSTIAIGIISLLITSAFYEYLPQPTMVLLAVGLAFGIGFAIYGLFFEPYKQEKDKYLKR